MTALELAGVAIAAIAIGGLAIIGIELWTERGKPAHNHAEGERADECPRCSWRPRS